MAKNEGEKSSKWNEVEVERAKRNSLLPGELADGSTPRAAKFVPVSGVLLRNARSVESLCARTLQKMVLKRGRSFFEGEAEEIRNLEEEVGGEGADAAALTEMISNVFHFDRVCDGCMSDKFVASVRPECPAPRTRRVLEAWVLSMSDRIAAVNAAFSGATDVDESDGGPKLRKSGSAARGASAGRKGASGASGAGSSGSPGAPAAGGAAAGEGSEEAGPQKKLSVSSRNSSATVRQNSFMLSSVLVREVLC